MSTPVRVGFRRFYAVDHPIENAEFRWAFNGSRPLTSLGEIALLSLWKVCDACEHIIPLAGRLRNRTVLDVYLGALLSKSDLRTQLAGLRNQAQYGNAGTGV